MVRKKTQWDRGVIIHSWLFCLGQAFTLVDAKLHFLMCDLEAEEALMVGAYNLNNYGDFKYVIGHFHTLIQR